jgi:uncharacterized repeat protein (TIGR04138 family)
LRSPALFLYIPPGEPLDETGTICALCRHRVAAVGLGREGVSRIAPADERADRESLSMQEISLEDVLERILAHDSRYHRDAYVFVREALDFTQKVNGKEVPSGKHRVGPPPVESHVSGQELLQGIRNFSLKEFGPMAITVFEEWGITSCADFGNIVFNMVETGLLSKTDKDCHDDFAGGYDFQEAFRKPFLPANKLPDVPAVAKPGAR